jgi:hypothetical protein
MPVVSIAELKAAFEPGQYLGSAYFMNLIDTLADDRAAVHIGSSEPEDAHAVPFWFNDWEGTLSVFNGVSWVAINEKTKKYNMPESDGMPGQVLVTDGNGNVTWKTL